MRASVGIIVRKDDGSVLAIERRRNPGAWQLPQGGLNDGEEPIEGAFRELEEETGLARGDVEVVAEHPEWLAYELPSEFRTRKTGLGQVQKWFLFRLAAPEDAIRLPEDGEARAWAWTRLDDLASSTIEFRRPIYTKLADWVHGVRATSGAAQHD